MISFIIRRVLLMIPVIIGVSIVSFIIIKIPPGDYASTYETLLLGQGMSADDAHRAAQQFRVMYGLDQPAPIQYLSWVEELVTHGNFGYSFAYSTDVRNLIGERLPRTLFIAVVAHLVASLFGLSIGIYSATHQYGWGDNLGTVFAFIGNSTPRFFLALAIMYWLAFVLGQKYVGQFFSPQYVMAPWSWEKAIDFAQHIWPVIVIAGFGGMARNMRTMRANLLDVLNSQYVTTARAKGLSEFATIYKHAVPNALHPIIMYQGMVLPYMVQGELEAAIVLSLPTIAPLFADSLANKDIYVTGGILLMYGLILVCGNLLADLLLAALDPRIRYS